MQFDGRAFAQKILAHVHERAAVWQDKHSGRTLTLHSIYPFQDPASVTYTQLKQKDARANGMEYTTQALSLRESATFWAKAVFAANRNPAIQGVLVQKPSSQTFQAITGGTQTDFDAWWTRVSESIAPEKDVDCLGPDQLASLERQAALVRQGSRPALNNLDGAIIPATALATILVLLDMAGSVEQLRTKRVAVIGRSQIVGRPAAAGLGMLGVETELMSSQSDLPALLPAFDAIISATGKADLIGASSVKQGAWLIDVGAPAPEFELACRDKAEWWTPVPGGIGPITRACLLENAVRVATAQDALSGTLIRR